VTKSLQTKEFSKSLRREAQRPSGTSQPVPHHSTSHMKQIFYHCLPKFSSCEERTVHSWLRFLTSSSSYYTQREASVRNWT